MKRILALLALGIVLAGCGQKGALYLPEPEAPLTTGVAQESKNRSGGY